MNIYIPLHRGGASTLQDQIYHHMRDLIASRAIPGGARLPSIAQFSSGWRVSRNTVILSLARLVDEGYVENRPTRGMFAHSNPPANSPVSDPQVPPPVSNDQFWNAKDLIFVQRERVKLPTEYGPPVEFGFYIDDSVFRQQKWRKLTQQVMFRDGFIGGQFHPNAGLPSLREAVAEWLAVSRGIQVDKKQVVIVSGLQHAHAIISRALIKAGDKVVLEAPSYRGKLIAYHDAGATVTPVGLDRDGLLTRNLPRGPAKLVCVNPGYQMPTGVTMSLERRQRLIGWAEESGAYIFEEAMNDLLQLEGPMLPSLFTLSRSERVIHSGLFAPTLGGGLSLAYLVLPEPLLDVCLQLKLVMDSGQSWLDQEVLARFITSGELDALIRRRRANMLRRRDYVLENLRAHIGNIETLGIAYASRLSWLLPENGPSSHAVVAAARERGIGLPSWQEAGGNPSGQSISSERLMVIGYGGVAEDAIGEGIRRLADAIEACSGKM